jgi:hypothetical protein
VFSLLLCFGAMKQASAQIEVQAFVGKAHSDRNRLPQFPMTIVLGYSVWAGPAATFGYSIPVDIKRFVPRARTAVRDTMYV